MVSSSLFAYLLWPAGVVTISAGVSTIVPSEEGDQRILLERADKALYEAKRQGRNRVVAFCA